MTGAPDSPDAVARLLRLLDVERIDADLFRGAQPDTERPRVYGGQVAAQAVVAACRTVEDGFVPHSLHSYFLLPGDYAVPIVYDVERLRESRSFATRRVVARQHGRPIFYLTLDLQRPEEGFEHQDAMPEAAPPEQGLDMLAQIRRRGDAEADALSRELAALQIRHLGTTRRGLPAHPRHPSQARMWVRIGGPLGDDPVVHLAAFTYASDVSLLGASLAAHDTDPTRTQMASLDHTLWFHRPFRADEWWLYDQWSPSAGGGRGLSLGRVYDEAGRLVASAAQEGLIRPRRS